MIKETSFDNTPLLTRQQIVFVNFPKGERQVLKIRNNQILFRDFNHSTTVFTQQSKSKLNRKKAILKQRQAIEAFVNLDGNKIRKMKKFISD